MTYLPALRDAANDADLRGAPLAVYVWLVTNHLDHQEARPVKISGLSFAMRLRRNAVTRALRLLCLRGYLERRYIAREGYVYRAYLVKRSPLVAQNEHTHTAA